jgi:hypothetical protein
MLIAATYDVEFSNRSLIDMIQKKTKKAMENLEAKQQGEPQKQKTSSRLLKYILIVLVACMVLHILFGIDWKKGIGGTFPFLIMGTIQQSGVDKKSEEMPFAFSEDELTQLIHGLTHSEKILYSIKHKDLQAVLSSMKLT